MVVDEVQHQRQDTVTKVLTAAYRFLARIFQGGQDVPLKVRRRSTGQPGEHADHLVESTTSVRKESGPRITRCDPNLDNTAGLVSHDVKGVPRLALAEATRNAVMLGYLARSYRDLVLSSANDSVRSVRP
jgi:hypothetical protein